MLKKLKNFLYSGHERSIKVKKNILGIFVLRGISIAIGLILIPMTLRYLDPIKYGIWITLSSIIAWFSFLDIGLGGGLRNKLAGALAKNDNELARYYISTSYAILSLIIAIFLVVFFIINHFINWEIILNAPPGMAEELSKLALWVVIFFGLKFLFGLISTILKADQRPAASSGLDALGSMLSLGIIYILIKTTSNSLFYLGFWRSFSLAIVPIFVSVWFFSKNYRSLIPSRRYINFRYAKDLLSLGFKFFIIQICSIIIFTTDNIIISQVLGPAKVTPYVIVYRYFYVISVIFSMVSMPLWSAYTEAYVKKDYIWIRNALRKMLSLLLPTTVIISVMIILAKPIIINIWIGEDVGITTLLVIFMGFYVLLQAWNRIYSWVLNGIGELKCTLYAMIIGAIINIPISMFFAKTLSLGSSGVILGTIVSLSIFAIFGPFRVKKILRNNRHMPLKFQVR